jgi:23S rRNA pseudouridine2457 synthase
MRAVCNRDAADRSGQTNRVNAFRTLAFNKPYGVLSCFTDSQGRPTLAGFIPIPGVYAAGRLDFDSEGLLLLTSDGQLAHRIMDPRKKLPKVYWVQVERIPEAEALHQLKNGVLLGGRRTRPAKASLLVDPPQLPPRPVPIRYRKSVPTAWNSFTVEEGLNRQVRRMAAAVGHPALRLVRVGIGPIMLGDLQPGEWRELSDAEVDSLRRV